MLEIIILEDTISYTFMSRNKKFIVDVEAEKLQGTSNHLVDKLLGFIGTNMDDHPDAETDFEDWIFDAVLEDVERLAPPPDPNSWKPTTLLAFHGAETFYFELVNRDGELGAVQHTYDPTIHGDSRPAIPIVDSDICDPDDISGEKMTIICPSGRSLHPRISASEGCRSRVCRRT